MQGYVLKEADYVEKVMAEDEFWSIFSGMFSGRVVHDTSYKYGFFKSILDSIYSTDDNLVLTFDQLFYKFTEIYWNLILKYCLRQKAVTKNGRETALERILKEAAGKKTGIGDICFESLPEEIKTEVCHKVKMKCKENVVGALYGDSGGVLYAFSKRKEYIKLNPQVYAFMTKYKKILEKINYFEWAKFLEKVNDETTTRNLLNNLDTLTLRNDLSVYRRILFEEFEEHQCFYCGKELKRGEIHVDHFIPWSFIKDDNLWNLVLTCSTCNLRKSDKLAPQQYVDRLVERNGLMLERNPDELPFYKENKPKEIYYWAKYNGYHEIWVPEKRVDDITP